jgi:hypothetical protein
MRCECEKIAKETVEKIQKQPDVQWCTEVSNRLKELPDNHIEINDETAYGCCCPACGNCVCGDCI